MRLRIVIVAILSLGWVIGSGLLAAQATQTLPSVMDVSGRVTDWSACPLPGATVKAVNGSGTEVARATTDADGEFHIRGLEWVPLRMSAELTGFSKATRVPRLTRGNNRWDVGITVGLMLDEPFRVTGTVLDHTKKPIASASVTIHSVFDESDALQARTDRTGKFELDLYQRGQYVVYATAAGHVGAATVVEASRGPIPAINLTLQPGRSCR